MSNYATIGFSQYFASVTYDSVNNTAVIDPGSVHPATPIDFSESTGDGKAASGESLYWTFHSSTWDDGYDSSIDASAAGSMIYVGSLADGGIVVSSGGQYQVFSDYNYIGGVSYSVDAIQKYVFCFTRGTRIATPDGERNVEDLTMGDTVLNTQGQAVSVKWLGRQTLHPLFAKLNGKMPIRIAQGALGDDIPSRNLFVSPDHAMLVDGVLVHASALINGRTITQMQTWEGDVEYFHIETEAHELILAEGAPAETFIDNVSREEFDNHAEYAALYPNAQPMVEMDLPRVKFARQLTRAISRRLEAVADELMGAQARAA